MAQEVESIAMAKKTAATPAKAAKTAVKKSVEPVAQLQAEPKVVKKPAARKRVTKPKVVVAPVSQDNVDAPTHGDVARLAYELWEQQGRPVGTEVADWLRAEQELAGVTA